MDREHLDNLADELSKTRTRTPAPSRSAYATRDIRCWKRSI
jgi:hypothetical protein